MPLVHASKILGSSPISGINALVKISVWPNYYTIRPLVFSFFVLVNFILQKIKSQDCFSYEFWLTSIRLFLLLDFDIMEDIKKLTGLSPVTCEEEQCGSSSGPWPEGCWFKSSSRLKITHLKSRQMNYISLLGLGVSCTNWCEFLTREKVCIFH